jgi:hypothetical protein
VIESYKIASPPGDEGFKVKFVELAFLATFAQTKPGMMTMPANDY